MTEFPEVVSAEVVRVEPGDVIWLNVHAHPNLTPEAAYDIKRRAQETWPDNEIIIADNIEIKAVRGPL